MTHPVRLLLLILVATIALGSQLPHLKIDTELEHFIDEDHPARMAYARVKEAYGRNDVIVVGVSAVDVLDEQTLRQLADLHRRIEQNVPWVRSVSSLLNATYQEGTADGLLVADLVPLPLGQLSSDAIADRIASLPALEGMVINQARTLLPW